RTTFPSERPPHVDGSHSQIVEGPISFFSLCEHHALPFHGSAHVAYVSNGEIVGISKLTRLVRLYARRFTVQERLGAQIADGVVAIPAVERSTALVAAGSAGDKFVMGLLRAFADVVLVGPGTLLASPTGRWRPDSVFPDGREAFAELRRRLGKTERPTVAVV